MLKIETASPTAAHLTVTLIGNIFGEYLPELEHVVQDAAHSGRSVAFDLSQIGLVDREAVRFFATGEGRWARLVGCPGYLREWLKSEGRPSPELTPDR